MKSIISDIRQEVEVLNTLLDELSDEQWNANTTFKDWTPQEVVAHLYYFDLMAIYSFRDKLLKYISKRIKCYNQVSLSSNFKNYKHKHNNTSE
mgnify:CR=1 FL=1